MIEWQYKALETVAHIVNGFSFKSGDFAADNNIKSVKITNVGVQDFIEQTDSLLPSAFMEKYASYQVSSGDIVIALTRTLISSGLKVALVPHSFDKALLNQRVAAIKTNPELLDRKFLYYFFTSQMAYDFVKSSVNELMQPNLSIKDLKSFSIPCPTIEEQKRIVTILDQAFADIEKACTTAETNLKSARELFDSYLQQVFSERGEDWIVTTIDDLVEEKILDKPIDGNHGEMHPKKADFVDSGIPFIMASDIKDGSVDTTNCSFISKQQADSLRKGFAKNDDVLLSHKATIGKTAILQTDLEYVMLTPQVTYYRILNSEILSNQYVYWYFNNPTFLNEMKEYAGAGSTRAYIGITKQRKLKFSYPSLTKQREIVSKLNFMVTEIEKLEPVYRKKISALNELKKSILQKAFTGELTMSKGIAA